MTVPGMEVVTSPGPVARGRRLPLMEVVSDSWVSSSDRVSTMTSSGTPSTVM